MAEVVVPSCAVGFIDIMKMMGFVSFISVQDGVPIKSSTSWLDGRIRVSAHQTTLSHCHFQSAGRVILSRVCVSTI